MIEIDDVTIALKQGGSGPIGLLFIHGIRNAAWVWDPTLERLDSDRFSWLAIDLPGCGESGNPSDWSGCTVAANGALVQAIVEQRFENAPIMIGHSLGAAIALEAALTREATSGVVLVAPAPLAGVDVPLDQLLAGAFASENDVEQLGRAAFSSQPSSNSSLHPPRARRCRPSWTCSEQGAPRRATELAARTSDRQSARATG